MYQGLIIFESLEDPSILNEVETIHKEVWDTNNDPRFWTAISFTSEKELFPTRLSEALKKNWYADFKDEKNKYIVVSGFVFSYALGDNSARETICCKLLELGFPLEQLDWSE